MSLPEQLRSLGTPTRLPHRDPATVGATTTVNTAESYGPMALAVLGCAALTLVRLSSAWVPAGVLSQVATVLLFVAWLERRARRVTHWKERRNLLAISMTVMLLATVFWQWVVDVTTGQGEAVEVLMLTGLQQTTLFLAAFRTWRLASRWSVVASGFLVIFTAAIDGRAIVMVLTLLYVFGAAWWLMADYWQSIAPGMTATQTQSRQPLRWPLLLVIGGVSLLALRAVPREAFYSLTGFMPTSGGDSWGDASARNGVGEGELLVAGQNSASTFGPVDSELFLESTEPTLYDVFSDIYGKPKPKNRHERAIGLSNDSMIENHRKISETSQASNGFSTVRDQSRKVDTSDKKVPENEVLQIAGTVPTHLAIETFDRFDGIEWSRSTDDQVQSVINPQMVHQLGEPWMQAKQYVSRPWLVPGRGYQLRVFHFSSPRIPSPPHFCEWHIDQLNQPSFFVRTSDAVWAFADRDRIPSLTVIHSRGAAHRPMELERTSFDSPLALDASDCVSLPIVQRTARRWTAGEARGWSQIEALIQRLREEIAIDVNAEVPDDVLDSGAWVLQHRRGTDFLVASLACQMLHSLGYQTRLVTGFYADSQNYDSKLGFTHIYKSDAHVWCEVMTASGDWIPLEPSAGYRDTAAMWTFSDRVRWMQQVAWKFVRESWPLWLLIACSIALVWELRLLLADALVCGWLRLCVGLTGRVSGARVLWLLETRGRIARAARPKSQPLLRWYRPLTSENSDHDSAWQSLQREWYAADASSSDRQQRLSKEQRSLERLELFRALVKLPRAAFVQLALSHQASQCPSTDRSRRNASSKPEPLSAVSGELKSQKQRSDAALLESAS